MTLSTTSNKVSFSGNGSTTVFAYNFKILANSDLKVYIRSATGTETLKTISTHYNVSGVGSASGGNVTFTGGNVPTNTETVIIQRVVALTQTHDYVENDPFPAESHEEGLDRLTMHVQQIQEEVDRSIKASVTNTISSSEFSNSPTDRANKIFGFDSTGDISVTTNIGTNRGDWASGTDYNERDLVKDTSTNNVFQVNTTHTSSGSQPLTSNANASKYDLLVDSASASTSATASANSATASANSATASANSATASATSEANSLTHSNTASGHVATALGHSNTASGHSNTASGHSVDASQHKQTAERWANLTGSTVTDVDTGIDSGEYSAKHYSQASSTTFTNFEKIYLGSKSSAPTADNNGVTLDATYEGTLYFNSTTDDLYVWNGSAWEQASFSAGGFLSQANNLSDVSNAGTSRTNLGLGTSAVLNVGTSANNIPQLDGNAKLPAIDGSQLTGLASGTDAIDMVVGTGSDAISAGHVVTRESNGETKKIKQVTATTNYSLAGRSHQNSTAGYSGANMMFSVGCMGMKGRYLHAWRGNNNQIYLSGYAHTGSGSWSKGSEVNTNYDHDANSYARMKISYVPTLNTSAGGTFFVQLHHGQSSMCGNYCGRGGTIYLLKVTVDANGTVTNHGGGNVISQLGVGTPQNNSVVYADHVVISAGNETCEIVLASICTAEYYGIYSDDRIGGIVYSWNGSSYTDTSYNSGAGSLGITDNSYSYNNLLIEYDHTNDVIVVGRYEGSYLRMRSFKKSGGNWSNVSSLNDSSIQNSTSYRGQPARYCSASGEGYVFFGKTDNNDITIRGYEVSSSGSFSSFDVYNGSHSKSNRTCSIYYSFINNKIYLPENTPSDDHGSQGYVRSYTLSGQTVTASTSVSANQSPDILYGQSFSVPYDKFSTGFTAENEVRYFAVYSNSESSLSSSMYKSGVYEGSVTATTTNKLLAFGFAQKGGNAGDTISVLPFDSESIEQNQTSLTHNSDYYVTDTGVIGTSAGTDNVFVGKAIHTTNIRLPSKDISASGGGGDPRIFCGAINLKGNTQANFTLSKLADLSAQNIRSYVIEFYGIGFSANSGTNFRFKPYNGGSSVLTGNTWYNNIHYAYNGGSNQVSNSNWSSYLAPAQWGGENIAFGNNTQTIQDYNGADESPRLSGEIWYENNFKNGGYRWRSEGRYSTDNNDLYIEHGVAGASGSATTTNYADSFYFYTNSGNYVEGIVVLYAITL